ncbi:MAG: FHA domain-containing protein [Pyrinomonadaceae bacterium]
MSEKQPVAKKGFTADWLMQGALTRIGDTLDRLTGRRWTPSSSLATSGLIERLIKLIDSEAVEVAGKGTVVPHNIKLKIQWDKFSTDADDSIKKLEDELLIAAADHINDRLYYTHAPLHIEVKPDYFTEGVKLFVSFDKFGGEDHEAELNVTVPSINLNNEQTNLLDDKTDVTEVTFIARFKIKDAARERKLSFHQDTRLSIGRTGSNDLILDDVSISKIHASLVADTDDNLSVADTGSTNGTFINDTRIAYGKAVKLIEGDRVKFGSIEVVFERVEDASALAKTDDDLVSSGQLSRVDTQKINDADHPNENEVDK